MNGIDDVPSQERGSEPRPGTSTVVAQPGPASAARPEPPIMDRSDWEAAADRLLAAVRPHFSPRHARMVLPGPVSSYGVESDGLEGFARTFLLAGFRLAGRSGDQGDPAGLAAWYREGLIAGTDPGSGEAWPSPATCAQAKVEAASIALILDLTRPLIWDTLTEAQQQAVIEWFTPIVGDDTYPRCNWLWFRVVVETFLRSVGGPWSEADIRSDLALHDEFYRADGWYSDGDERAFDYYVGWAMHLYPVLWARMRGARDLAAERGHTDRDRLARYIQDFVRLEGADGSPLFQGRSLIYRFATAAPYWVAAVAGVDTVPAGVLRHAASGMLRHFGSHGVPTSEGLLTLGWFEPWARLRQAYSGSSSPYWASKGMLGLALPADSPVWTADEGLLPVETADQLFTIRAPGWIVSATRADGIVRVINHGTDHALPGAAVGDSPLYARIGYSTVTTPLLDEDSERNPLDQSVVLLDAEGRASHRAGMVVLDLARQGDVAHAASTVDAHWMRPSGVQEGHGSGLEGTALRAGRLTIASLVRGAWEVRLFRVDDPAEQALRVRVGGWALTGQEVVPTSAGPQVAVRSGRLGSALVPLLGTPQGHAVDERPDASPLPGRSLTPTLTFPLRNGEWQAVGVLLDGTGRVQGVPSVVGIRREEEDVAVEIRWADGATTRSAIRLSFGDGTRGSHQRTSRPTAVPCGDSK